MLQNKDGTFSMTAQFDTWTKYDKVQIKDTYTFPPKLPEELECIPNHPKPSNLRLVWTFDGEWVLLPMNSNQQVDLDLKNGIIGRIERYIGTDGKLRKAFSYGDEDHKLIIWYNLEDMYKMYPGWIIIEPTIFYNGRKFSRETRRSQNTKSKNSIDKPRDNQGEGYRRGYSRGRGASYPYARGSRGVSTTRGGARGRGRPMRRNSRWNNDYQEWDRRQSAENRPYRNQPDWEEESWSDMSQEEYYEESQENEGYHNDRFDRRKRSRSPSERGYRNRDSSPKQERGRGRSRPGRGYGPNENEGRRYPSMKR